jgi:hypothetical protein
LLQRSQHREHGVLVEEKAVRGESGEKKLGRSWRLVLPAAIVLVVENCSNHPEIPDGCTAK